MSVQTHDSKWRVIIAAAPLLLVVLLLFAFVQGEHGIFRSRQVQQALLALGALGLVVSAWTAWRLGAAPAVSIARAPPGRVSLHGKAQPLPGAAPLVSPDGLACLWFTHSQKIARRYDSVDSVRPFLLVDDSGSCVVLPAGAEIHGSSKTTVAKSVKLTDSTDITGRGASYGMGERVLCTGDEIHVSGWFTPASAEAIELQTKAAELNAKVDLPTVVVRSNDPDEFRKMLAAAPPALPPIAPPIAPLALPVVAGHGAAEPFIIGIGAQDGDAAVYWLLAVVDGLVLCAAAGLYLWAAPVA